MKIISDVLKNTAMATEAGTFKVDTKGVVDVPEEVAKELIAVGSFVPVETQEPKTDKKESKQKSE